MNRSIRKLVGGGAAALAIGGFFALIVAPQLAGASSESHRTQVGAGVANVITHMRTEQTAAIDKKVVAIVHVVAKPLTSCTTAKANLALALTADKAEDTTERAKATSDPNFKTTEIAEDRDEATARKPLVDAVRAKCTFIKPMLSQQCSAALQSLKVAFQAELSEGVAEKAAGTEGTAGDVTEDKTEMARFAALFQSLSASCPLGTHDAFTWFGLTKTLSFQH
ncbi:MAG TPA: hypothetical protein VNU19_04195 [Candidatus Acidoferrum sp.]|jgi:hypothetical protein|nr:hypothetical protein [Candidatus Acidoferrum sp.]